MILILFPIVVTFLLYAGQPFFLLAILTIAFHFLANNRPIKAIGISEDFLVFKDKNSSIPNSKLFTNINQVKIRDFDNVVSSFQKVKKVSLNRTTWTYK